MVDGPDWVPDYWIDGLVDYWIGEDGAVAVFEEIMLKGLKAP